MALLINLCNDEGKPYSPGSMVVGVVKFDNDDDQIIDSLAMDFKGLTKVFLNQKCGDLAVSRPDYISEGYLFSRHLDLYNGGQIQQKGTYTWPFAFRIPLFASRRAVQPGSKEMFSLKHPWKGDVDLDAHPLPPSMLQTRKFICSIRYVVEATLVKRQAATHYCQRKGKLVQASRSLSVQNLEIPSCFYPGGDWPYVIHRHIMHRPLAEPSSLHRTIHHLLPIISKMGLHSKPGVKLRFSILLPRKLEIIKQQVLSIPVCCTVDRASVSSGEVLSTVERNPASMLCSFKLYLVQHVHVRAGRHDRSSSEPILIRKGSAAIPISCGTTSLFKGASSPPTSFVNLFDTIDLSVPVETLAADFSTYNIARFHSIEVYFEMNYEGIKHKFSLHRVPLKVVPQSTRELELRLSEGVEEDDVYGCEMAGIQWRDYVIDEPSETFHTTIEGCRTDNDSVQDTPPPAYTA